MMANGVHGTTGVCVPRLVTVAGNGASECAKGQVLKVTHVKDQEKKSRHVMRKDVQVRRIVFSKELT